MHVDLQFKMGDDERRRETKSTDPKIMLLEAEEYQLRMARVEKSMEVRDLE
jgi:hypothetical protein